MVCLGFGVVGECVFGGGCVGGGEFGVVVVECFVECFVV